MRSAFRKRWMYLSAAAVSALSAMVMAPAGRMAAQSADGTAASAGVVAPGTEGPFIYAPVVPASMDVDVRTLQKASANGPVTVPRAPGATALPDIGPGDGDAAVQTEETAGRSSAALRAPIVNFDGIQFTGFFPPDTNADVGPNHIVEMVNTHFAVYNKTGTLLAGPTPINQLWTAAGVTTGPCATQNAGDPVVAYDRLADRWVLSQFANPSHLCFAVSKTASPIAGGYNVYEFNVGVFPDYFKVGVWPTGYFVAANFGNQVGVIALNRTAMLAGAAANIIQFNAPGLPGLGGNFLLPSDLDGPMAPPANAPNIYYRQVDGNNFGGVDRIELFSFNANFANPGMSTFTQLPSLNAAAFDSSLCGFFSFACVPQPGTATRLDPINEWPMYPFRYRNFGTHETLIGSFTVDANGADGHGIRWFELRRTGGNWFIQQQGTYAPQPGGAFVHRWIPGIAMDNVGNVGLGYSVSASAGIFPSIRYTGRLVSDPPGTLPQAESTIIAGTTSQTSNSRWGDYASMSVDPSDDCTFWYANQYVQPGGTWRTRIASFNFPGCGGGGGATVTVAALDGTAIEAGLDPGSFRVSRTGSTASALTVNIGASGTATPGADYSALPATAVIPAGASFVDVPVTPLADTLKEPNETVILTVAPGSGYTVGSPSSATVTIVEGQDLIISAITAPVAANPGQTIAIKVTTKNQGTLATAPTMTRVWLSLNKIVDGGDAILFTVNVPALAPNGANIQTVNAAIPPGTPLSKRFLIARADAVAPFQVESNETNNERTRAITIGPDYVTTALSTVPTNIPKGSNFTINDTAKNTGAPVAINTTTRFFLSLNTIVDAGDVVLGNRVVPPLGTNQTSAGSTVVTMPAGTASGTWRIIAVADFLGQVGEVNEANNKKLFTVTVP